MAGWPQGHAQVGGRDCCTLSRPRIWIQVSRPRPALSLERRHPCSSLECCSCFGCRAAPAALARSTQWRRVLFLLTGAMNLPWCTIRGQALHCVKFDRGDVATRAIRPERVRIRSQLDHLQLACSSAIAESIVRFRSLQLRCDVQLSPARVLRLNLFTNGVQFIWPKDHHCRGHHVSRAPDRFFSKQACH